MIGYCSIKGVGKDFRVISLFWKVKEVRNKKRKVSALKIFLDENELEQLGIATRTKTELLISNLLLFRDMGKLKTELDLELFINSFMREYSPAILFNGKRHFSKTNLKDNEYIKPRAKEINKKYINKKVRKRMRDLLINEGTVINE